MARCKKYDEDMCIGHDCMDRVGTPRIWDAHGSAGTEDVMLADDDMFLGLTLPEYDDFDEGNLAEC